MPVRPQRTRRFSAGLASLSASVTAAIGFAGCGAAPPVIPVPPVTSAFPTSSSAISAFGPHADADANASRPNGALDRKSGADNIQADALETYRPRALSPDIARPIQLLTDVRAPGIGELSPDGKALYFAWSVTGTSQVWKIDGPKRFPQQLTGGEDGTTLVAVTPDGRTLVLQRDRKGEENPGLYVQAASGGLLETIAHVHGVQTHFEALSSDSKYVYFTSNERKPDAYVVYRYDIGKKEKQVVFDKQDGLWHVGDVKDDGRILLRRETGSLTAEYFEWNPTRGELVPLLGVGEKEEYEARYGAREGELVVLTNKLGEFRHLYTFANEKLTLLGADGNADVDAFDIDRGRTRLLYTTNDGGYSRLHALDLKTGKPLAGPQFLDADRISIGPTTPDGRFTTMGVDDGIHPLTGYVVEWANRKAAAWHAPSTPETDTTRFARARGASYSARDGTKIPVLVRRPPACASAPCPVVVNFHGGPESQARPGFSVGAQMFVDAGFVVVEPNVRGSDGYGKTWLHADDGPKRLDVIGDIEDAARWARVEFAEKGTPPKVGIYGGSYGGYSALIGMTMFAGVYDAGVDVVGISDLRTFLRNTAPYRRILRQSEYGDPERDADALAKLSPMTYVDRVRGPLLILQGANDPRVPAGEAIQIHDALARKGIPCELMIFGDEGHGAQKRENRVLMLGHAIAFLKAHLL